MLYQTQQKLKKKSSGSSGRHRRREKSSGGSSKVDGDSRSVHSSTHSMRASNDDAESSTSFSGVNSEELSESLQKLKETHPDDIVVPTPVEELTSPAESHSPSTKRLEANRTSHMSPKELLNEKHRSNSAFSSVSGSSVPSSFKKAFRRNSSLTSYQSYLLVRSSPSETSPSAEVENPMMTRRPHLKSKGSSSSAVDQVSSGSLDMCISSTSTEVGSAPVIPEYVAITDPSVMNSIALVTSAFLNPVFQIQRFRNFLDFYKDHHVSDPVNFASVRLHCLLKFIKEHQGAVEWSRTHGTPKFLDSRKFEAHLCCQLLTIRSTVRRMVAQFTQNDPSRRKVISNEELVQLNFTNYVRYIFGLGVLPPAINLTEFQKEHYACKEFMNKLQKSMEILKREELGSDIDTSSMQTVLKLVTKSAYEFVLLEKYHIHILSRLSSGYLIEKRSVRRLFDYQMTLGTTTKEPPKVLLFNNFYSSQYSWHLSLSLPFARVFHTSIYNEAPRAETEHLSRPPAKRFWDYHMGDDAFFEAHLKDLKFDNFKAFERCTPRVLVDIGEEAVSKEARANELLQPFNFLYHPYPLDTIPPDTFDVIQSRDLHLQLTPENYKKILKEFFNILKPGGTLEISLIQFAKGVSGKFDCHTYGNLDLRRLYDIIPEFLSVMMQELAEIFGKEKVAFSISVLNPENEVTDFLVKHWGLILHDIFGAVDDFCLKVSNSAEATPESGFDLNQLVYIRAEKPCPST